MRRTLALTFGFSWLLAGTIWLLGVELASPLGLVVAMAIMWVPGLAALLASRREGIRLPIFRGWKAGSLVAGLLGLAIFGFSLLYGRLLGLEFAVPTEITLPLVVVLLVVLIAGMTVKPLTALGEELMWRGYLWEKVKHLGMLRASLAIGSIWAIWHAPLIFMGLNYPGYPVAGLFMMIVASTAMTPLAIWVRTWSGGIWSAAVLHGTINASGGLAILCFPGASPFVAGLAGISGVLACATLWLLISRSYSLVIHFYSVFAFLHFKLRRSRRSLSQCLGFGAPVSRSGALMVVWFHAVSVGETKAIAPLAKRLRETHPETQIVVSSVTDTGHAEAVKGIPEADHHIFLPFDIPHVMRRVVGQIKPDLLVMSETDYWYSFMSEVKSHGGKILVANAKLSERSMRRYRRMPRFSSKVFGMVDTFCLQSELYRERLASLGVADEKMVLTGNLKFDARPAVVDTIAFRDSLKIDPEERIIVLGSTHDPEEEILLDALQAVPGKILLVPRHPQRFDEVAELLQRKTIPFGRYSKAHALTGEERVVLIDAMGLLCHCYQIASQAIVAGSFVDRVGGHNILEPLWFDVPTYFGPYMWSQADMAELVLSHNAGRQVTAETLAAALDQTDHNGQELLSTLAGSLDRTWIELDKCLPVDQKSLAALELEPQMTRGGAVVSSSGS